MSAFRRFLGVCPAHGFWLLVYGLKVLYKVYVCLSKVTGACLRVMGAFRCPVKILRLKIRS